MRPHLRKRQNSSVGTRETNRTYARALWDLAEDGDCPFDGDNTFEEGSGPDQDFHIMVFILVRKKKKLMCVCIYRGVWSETADAFDLEETCQHPQKRLECSVPDRSQPSGDMNVGNTICNTGGSLPKLLRAGSAALAERKSLRMTRLGSMRRHQKDTGSIIFPDRALAFVRKGLFPGKNQNGRAGRDPSGPSSLSWNSKRALFSGPLLFMIP